MKIDGLFQQKSPVLSFEIFPPKKAETLKSIDETLEELSKLNPDFISVTYGAGGSVTNNATLEIANKIKNQYGIEPVVHLTCINHSKNDILKMIQQLKENQLDNVLALRGDINPDILPKKDFLYASDLVEFLKENSTLGISGACYPEGHIECNNLERDLIHLKTKVDAGVTHLVSQLFFDNPLFYNFREKTKALGITVPMEAGIMPVVNKNQIERMVTMCGASLPPKFKKIIEKYENDKEALFDAGMAYAINQIVDLLAHDVDGIHIFTMNNPIVARRICEGIKNLL